MDNFENVFSSQHPLFSLSIPPILSESEREKVTQASDNVGSMFSSVSASNFFLALLKAGSMQQLWGLIRTVQLIVLSSLIEIDYPPITAEFFKNSIHFAK